MNEEAGTPPSVAIVTDSTSDLPAGMAERYGITVVPLSVTVGEETFDDGALTTAEFFERMNASPVLPTTSQPPVGRFVEAYRTALDQASEVVSVHISSGLSGTVEAARQAAESFEGRVRVFDSLNLSMGLGFQVLAAARTAASGALAAEVLAAAERTRDRVRMIVGFDRLDNLAKGGRIGAVSAFLGGLLDVRVTITVSPEGVFVPVARTRGSAGALRHTMDWVAEQMDGAKRGAFCVLHAMSPERAERLRDEILARYEADEVFIVETGAVISTHTGTGWAVALVPGD